MKKVWMTIPFIALAYGAISGADSWLDTHNVRAAMTTDYPAPPTPTASRPARRMQLCDTATAEGDECISKHELMRLALIAIVGGASNAPPLR